MAAVIRTTHGTTRVPKHDQFQHKVRDQRMDLPILEHYTTEWYVRSIRQGHHTLGAAQLGRG